jgi:hypothetical protein
MRLRSTFQLPVSRFFAQRLFSFIFGVQVGSTETLGTCSKLHGDALKIRQEE